MDKNRLVKSSEIIVFPNHRVETDSSLSCADENKKDVWMVRPLQNFLSEIRAAGGTSALAAATMPYSPESRNNSKLTENQSIKFFPLGGTIIRRVTLFRKTVGYSIAMFQLLFYIPKKPFWYIQYPGPIGYLACIVCRIYRKPFGLYVRCDWKSTGWLGMLNRYYFRKAASIIATGEAFKKSLLEFNESVQEVAPMTSFDVGDVQAKESYEIQDEAVILFVGQLHPKKGVLELIRAVAQVGRNKKLRLVVVGDSSGMPEMPGKIEAVICENHCQHLIELVGQVRDKKELASRFEEADLFVLPTYYPEGFPRVVYEAMIFGLPVLCTDVEGREGFLRESENCRYVKKQSSDDLAVKLIELLEDQELRRHLGTNGSQDVRDLLARFDGTTHGMQVMQSLEACSSR